MEDVKERKLLLTFYTTALITSIGFKSNNQLAVGYLDSTDQYWLCVGIFHMRGLLAALSLSRRGCLIGGNVDLSEPNSMVMEQYGAINESYNIKLGILQF